MLTSQAAQSAFQQAGVRLTPQRMIIVNALVGNRTHPSIDDLFARIRQRHPTISLATIYKTVDLLARHGLVVELHGSKNGVHCDPDTSPHAHAYCEQCGHIFDLPNPEVLPWDEPALKGFRPNLMEISLYGMCATCARKAKRSTASK